MVDTLDKACTRWGTIINGVKTKTMRIGVDDDNQPAITLKDNTLQTVEVSSYLESEVGQTTGVDGGGGNTAKEGSHGLPDVEEGSL